MITLDDQYRLEDFGIRAEFDHEHPATSEITRKTISIPGMAGEWDFGAERGPKSFNLPMRVNEKDRTILQSKLDAFVAFMHDPFGKPRPVKAAFDYDAGKFYMMKLAAPIVPERVAIAGRFVLSLVASDPNKYSGVFADEITWGSEEVTFAYDYLLGREGLGGGITVTGPQTISVPVAGLAVQPIFEISGAATGLIISANGYSFKVPNFTSGSWTVDFQKYTAYRNGQERMIDMRDFWLMPGDNAVKITGSGINIEMRIKYRDKYM